MNTAPAITSASLLASRIRLPARAAASVGRNPAAPTMAAMTESAVSSVATASSPSGPLSTVAIHAGVAQPLAQSLRRRLRSQGHDPWTMREALLEQQVGLVVRR